LSHDIAADDLRGVVERLLTSTERMNIGNVALDQHLADSRQEANALRDALARVKVEASSDPLTGLANPKVFDERLQALARSDDYANQTHALLIGDIDSFKRVNDTHGHSFGEKIIRAVTKAFASSIKGKNIAARFGGEEFVVFPPEPALRGARSCRPSAVPGQGRRPQSGRGAGRDGAATRRRLSGRRRERGAPDAERGAGQGELNEAERGVLPEGVMACACTNTSRFGCVAPASALAGHAGVGCTFAYLELPSSARRHAAPASAPRLWLSALLLAGWMIATVAAPRDSVPQPPSPSLSAEQVVRVQLDALRHNDEPVPDAGIAQTWALAHPGNQRATGPYARFRGMLHGAAFKPLLNHHGHTVEVKIETPTAVTFAVLIQARDGRALGYAWTVERVASGPLAACWLTTAVSPPIELGTPL